MKGYYLWTVGCQMNKAESLRLAQGLEALGYHQVPQPEQADFIVLNSCTVRQKAEDRVVARLSSLRFLKRGREATLILMGCMVDSNLQELQQRFPYVDSFVRPGDIQTVLRLAGLTGSEDRVDLISPSLADISAYVPIAQGCDKFCAYCIVPYRRGRERSREVAEVVEEVKCLVARGTKEVILLGQNVDSYGHDLPDKPDLAYLLEELEPIPGLERIRFLTSHPKDMNQRLIQAVTRLPKVCEHINLPLQSGDNAILGAMGRGYTREEYVHLVEHIRAAIPQVALSTDVIVGFPGEGEERFHNTIELLEETRFDTVHVAAYSPRPGTRAARLPDDVPPLVKRERRERVEQLQERTASLINAQYLGRQLSVLVEGKKGGKWWGRTPSYKQVFFSAPGELLGKIVAVEIEKSGPWSLQGSLVGY
ncbi:MAG: tRNA (N6-isopentenyl adenosine(37)-C2)-methylthiotransferase MiaB [Chloroflexi bacterium]|nr:tRNA (N6-isopentenyl adenosine(37)-C2)-methylthiotransferase MiaB [Chloroflexota bacterium]